MISDPAVVVLVAEDAFNPMESQSVAEPLRQTILNRQTATPQGKVVVGICSINLKPGSTLIGQFKTGETGGKHAGSFEKCSFPVTDQS
jgi:hypothetical protein